MTGNAETHILKQLTGNSLADKIRVLWPRRP